MAGVFFIWVMSVQLTGWEIGSVFTCVRELKQVVKTKDFFFQIIELDLVDCRQRTGANSSQYQGYYQNEKPFNQSLRMPRIKIQSKQ